MNQSSFKQMMSDPEMDLSVWIGNRAAAKPRVRKANPSPTARQAEVLRFVDGYIKEFGYPPSIPDVSAGFGFRSKNSAGDHLASLIKKGYLIRAHGIARSIRITEKGREFLKNDRGAS